MDKRSAQIATICECIDHCFAFLIWCADFASSIDPDDVMAGLEVDLISDATRLHSFLALRKLDDFFGGVRPQPGDLVAADFGVDVPSVLGDVGKTFLSETERVNINKGVAHLTEQLSLDPDSEVELDTIVKRSIPVLKRLVAALRKADASKEATQWLDKSDSLIERGGTM
jgi:hypothetical protein